MEDKPNVSQISRGINLDANPVNQPQGTRRFTLNAVDETTEGDLLSLGNEPSNEEAGIYPFGYIQIGKCYMYDNQNCVFLHNDLSERDSIGIVRNDTYIELINSNLGFRLNKQIDCEFRIHKGNLKAVYFVDAHNDGRYVSLDRLSLHYSTSFIDYLNSGGNPAIYTGEKWDASSFSLFKIYNSFPVFAGVEILEYGTILPGSYNFAVRMLDTDLNATHWITTSNIVNIFNDSLANTYGHIRGSKNSQTDAQFYGRASKSIKLTFSDIDSKFPYYQIAVIQGTSVTGKPTRALTSSPISTTTPTYIYTGDDANMTEVPLPEILLEKTSINSPSHIEQLENRLELAGGRDLPIPFCDFQQYASKIRTDVELKEVILNTVLDPANPKNADSDFTFLPYMPGQPVSLGIVYLIDNYELSPVFHIPGRNPSDSTSDMLVHEINDSYQKIHDCTVNNYWGDDAYGEPLTGRHIRHHRLPFRRDLGIPLVTKTPTTEPIGIDNHKLSVKITLKPGKTYPLSPPVTGDPIPISYRFTYKLSNVPNELSFTGLITDKDMGVEIVIYDDINIPVPVTGSTYIVLDPTCQLYPYTVSGGGSGDTFEVDYLGPIAHTVTTIIEADITQIMGIRLSNIQKPHSRVIGFFIVRNELTDADKIVIDNALIGNVTKYQKYRSFNHFIPEMLNEDKDNKSVYVFSPMHQFTGLKTDFKDIRIQGYYEQKSKIIGDVLVEGSTDFNTWRGVLIEDVAAGTSYNAEIHKKKQKDGDGFDLQIGTVGREFTYNLPLGFSPEDQLYHVNQLYYVNAAFNRTDGTNIYYNTSIDNKICFAIFNTGINLNNYLGQPETNNANPGDPLSDYPDYPASMGDPNYKYRVMYAALTVDNQTSYTNFMDRPYYKEHNNPVMFGDDDIVDNVQIFNGDAHIGAMSLVSSVFYETQIGDRDKKNKTWQIIAGGVLLIAGVALAIWGPGIPLLAGAVSILAPLIVSYGVSIVMSGIKFEAMKGMIDNDYPAGLKQTVEDAQVMRQIKKERTDDTFKWFSGLMANLYLESYINIPLRSGLTIAGSDFFNAPKEFNIGDLATYLTDKFTTIDKEHDSGRLYKGYAQAELYDANLDYHRRNKEKVFYHLPINYDCCNREGQQYPNRVWYSEQSFQEEFTDNYRIFLPNNYRDIEAEFGPITDLFRQDDNLYIHTTEGLWKLRASYQEKTIGDIVSYVGTGQFFSIPPVPIRSADLGTGGSKHKWATVRTDKGICIVSEIEGRIYMLMGGQLQPISDDGLISWFKNNLYDYFAHQYEVITDEPFPNQNNPANPYGIGIHSIYDPRYDRIVITKRDYLVLDINLKVVDEPDEVTGTELHYIKSLGRFAILNDDSDSITFSESQDAELFEEPNQELILYPYLTFIRFDNPDYFENKSWTISFSLKQKGYWCSWHTYMPNFYFNTQNGFYSVINDNKFWKHNVKGKYGHFYGVPQPHMIEYVVKSSPITVSMIDWFMIQSVARKWNAAIENWFEVRNKLFTKLIAYNERQCTGECIILPKDENSPEFLSDQTITSFNQLIASRKETNWTINQLRDFVDDYSQPFLTKQWSNIKAKYFIDKVINPAVINFNKEWYDLESFRDKYLVIRLIFDNFDDVNLLTNYLLETETPSIR